MPKKTDDNGSLLDNLKAKMEISTEDDLLSKITDWIPSGSLVVDAVIAGGRNQPCPIIPYGRQIELAGKEHSGKTTLCAMIAKQVQQRGGLVAIVDSEDRLDEDYWTSIGVDLKKTLSIGGRTLEDVFNQQYKLLLYMRENSPETPLLIIWDSLGGTRLKSITEGVDPDDIKKNPMAVAARAMGKKARVISIGMELLNPMIAEGNVCYLYTNHLYYKMDTGGYGDPFETLGGMKPKYFATLRLRLTRIGNIEEASDDKEVKSIIGTRVSVEAFKNSMSPYLLKKPAAIVGCVGFNDDYTVWETAGDLKLIAKGAWSTWKTPKGEEVKFQGWKGFQDKVVKHPEYPALVALVKAQI